ncbi:MAG: hypothetical protein LBN09_03760 [Clostridioides sp.]|jgi:hypothetical protein|nr:hypothetical protein [Clostridioides sp.]
MKQDSTIYQLKDSRKIRILKMKSKLSTDVFLEEIRYRCSPISKAIN